jgi:hypothetical protein
MKDKTKKLMAEIKRCEAACKRVMEYEEKVYRIDEDGFKHRNYVTGTRISGALRRATLDLSQALVDWRKP